MTMDANEMARLRDVATAATPGEWKSRAYTDHPEGTLSIVGRRGWVIRPTRHGGFLNENADAEHIATFDPPTVLALLDLLAEKDTEIERLRDVQVREMTRLGHTNTDLLNAEAERDAALAELERLTDTEKAQGVMIRELERLNTELNDELGAAVQVLKLERDAALTEVERWKRDSVCQCTGGPDYDGPEETCPRDGRTYTEWVQIASGVIGQNNALRDRLAAVEAVCREVERDEADYLARWGQHMTGAPVAVTEMIRATLAEGGGDPR